MTGYRYVLLDPTGNLTCLVLDAVPPDKEKQVTAALLAECEQVAYLEKPKTKEARAAIRMMGGEFCGNAAMATAAYLVREELKPGEEADVPLEVSGAEGVLSCHVKALGDCFEGTVPLPDILEVFPRTDWGIPMTAVRMEGIIHLIYCEKELKREDAESTLVSLAKTLPDDAAGLLHWDAQSGFMRPLVYVPGSGSLVWEHGCGSGSAAVGAAEALRKGDGTHTTRVRQPGGEIRACVCTDHGRIRWVRITGQVRCGKTRTLAI